MRAPISLLAAMGMMRWPYGDRGWQPDLTAGPKGSGVPIPYTRVQPRRRTRRQRRQG